MRDQVRGICRLSNMRSVTAATGVSPPSSVPVPRRRTRSTVSGICSPRGGKDMFLICYGLKRATRGGVERVPQATAATCILHLIRNTFWLTARQYTDEIKRVIKPTYTAVNVTAAMAAVTISPTNGVSATRQ
jgi:hypothetical protein